MKKILFILLILPFAWIACEEDKAPPPEISLKSLFINNNDSVDHKNSLNELPFLSTNDTVTMELELDGKGSALNTLNISSDNKGIKTEIWPQEQEEISDNKNFTDFNQGRIGFVDGITHSHVVVRAVITEISSKSIKISLHLSARTESEGSGSLELQFKTRKNIPPHFPEKERK